MSFEVDYKTYEEWQEEGMSVIRGEQSHQRDAYGMPLFSEDQVQDEEKHWSY